MLVSFFTTVAVSIAKSILRHARPVLNAMHHMVRKEECERAEYARLIHRDEPCFKVGERERAVSTFQFIQYEYAHRSRFYMSNRKEFIVSSFVHTILFCATNVVNLSQEMPFRQANLSQKNGISFWHARCNIVKRKSEAPRGAEDEAHNIIKQIKNTYNYDTLFTKLVT